jgi:hypothetical protein
MRFPLEPASATQRPPQHIERRAPRQISLRTSRRKTRFHLQSSALSADNTLSLRALCDQSLISSTTTRTAITYFCQSFGCPVFDLAGVGERRALPFSGRFASVRISPRKNFSFCREAFRALFSLTW